MTKEEAIHYLECGATANCRCASNKRHGGDCEGEAAVIEAINLAIEALEQPEIIYCKDCVYYSGKYCVVDYITGKSESTVTRDSDDFCSCGEKKEK